MLNGPPSPTGYDSPLSGTLVDGNRVIDVGEVARRQRAIMFCLLGYMGFILLVFLAVGVMSGARGSSVDKADMSALESLVSVIAFAVMVVTAVCVFRLALAVYGTGTGILMGLLTFIPMVGLIVLLIVNGKATSLLRRYGIRVACSGPIARKSRRKVLRRRKRRLNTVPANMEAGLEATDAT
jgi:hypothetical protein